MALKIFLILDKLIYHPVKGRVIYDLISSFFCVNAIFIIFWFYNNSFANYTLTIAYPIIFMFSNYSLGLYSKNKISPLYFKVAILLVSNLIAFALIMLISFNVFQLSLSFLICSLSTILPRFFLNFNVERTTFGKILPNSKNNPILVVGGGGYIGSVLVEKLLKNGERVRVFDKFIYSKEIFKGMRNLKNLELMEGDISDVYSITMAVKDSKAIIHLAGIVGDPAARVDEALTRHVNIASTRLLKETAKAFGVEKFIFASSCSVYGINKKLQKENSKPNPISLYAKTKLDSEKELMSDTADNFHPTILRFSTVFGHSRKPRFDLVANLFTAEAFANKKIKVYGGDQWRPFVHVKDIANAIILVLNSPNDKVSRQIFNVGSNRMNMMIKDLAFLVKKIISDDNIEILIQNDKKDKRNYRVSFEKIKDVLNFTPSITLEMGLREIYKNFLLNKYKKHYTDAHYVNYEITKGLKKEFRSKKYKKSHFSTIS